MTDTIMLEAPARGGRISDLADGQGRILRLHDLTASSLGHTSHANPDRKPINVANQTESPTRTGGRVTIERKPDEGDGPAVIHRLNDERDQRWQNLIAGFLIHASRGIVRHDGQHEYTAVPDGPWRTSAPYASSLSGAVARPITGGAGVTRERTSTGKRNNHGKGTRPTRIPSEQHGPQRRGRHEG